MEYQQQTFLERLSHSTLWKLVIMFFLILILLIPMSWINDLISERNNRSKQVSQEIASKWGRRQVISTPVIAIPYKTYYQRNVTDSKNKTTTITEEDQEWIFMLPNNTDINSVVHPETRKRGIYESIVYTSDIRVRGDFPAVDFKKMKIEEQNIRWGESKLLFGISDFKGLTGDAKFKWGTTTLEIGRNTSAVELFENSLSVDLPLVDGKSSQQSFAINMKIRGSEGIHFFPLANQTTIHVDGNWNHPSFMGAYLPEKPTIEPNHFVASWAIPSYNRKLPQQWNGHPTKLMTSTSVGDASYVIPEPKVVGGHESEVSDEVVSVQFLTELDNYQKTMRVAKYGILIILLTYVSLFFTEIIKKQRVHVIQYVLIGASMVLFYALLLSISEHVGFNWAYGIAAIATVTLIASFVGAITKNKKTALLFGGILSVFYLFIFQLLQLRDYSLIVGTVGLFLILAVLMRLSTKINWYQFEGSNDTN